MSAIRWNGGAGPAIRLAAVSSLVGPKGDTGDYAEVGESTIASGINTRVLYNNNGTLGEYAVSGTGDVAMTNSPTITTPEFNGAVTWDGGEKIEPSGVNLLFGGTLLRAIGPAEGNPTWDYDYSYGTSNTPLQSVSATGEAAIYGVSRSSDGSGGASAAVGVIGKAFNDRTAGDVFVWASYFEGFNYPGGGGAHGSEIEVSNFSATVILGPYAPYRQGSTSAAWIASGGNWGIFSPAYNPVTGENDLYPTTASVAIGIVYNGATFEKGIFFGATSLDGADGTLGGGYGKAIVLAQHHDFEFWREGGVDNVGVVSGRIRSHASADSAMVLFRNAGLDVFDVSGAAKWLAVQGLSSNVNYIKLTAADAGTAPQFQPDGADTNIGFVFLPKGNPDQVIYVAGAVTAAGAFLSGAPGSVSGAIAFYGATSGQVWIRPQAVAGSYNFNLPNAAGNAGELLASGGGGANAMTWIAATGTGSIVKAISPTITGTLNVQNIAMSGTDFTATSASAYMPQFTLSNQANDNAAGYFIVQKRRVGAANNGAVQVNDYLGSLNYKGCDQSGNMQNSATITAVVETVGASSVTARIQMTVGSKNFMFKTDGSLELDSGAVIKINNVQVVGAPKTGWASPTGTATRSTFATGSVTLPQLAERVKAMIDDFYTTSGHGLLAA